jgi:hypothetical protein
MRPPDLIIGPRDNPYMLRWHLLRFRGWQLALHKMLRDDDDRALHDHRGDNLSIVLRGGYLEWFSHRGDPIDCVWRKPGSIIFRRGETPHRLTLGYSSEDGKTQRPSWSLWLRWPSRREWGFYCPKGWIPWQKFCAMPDYSKPGSTSEIGPGCD